MRGEKDNVLKGRVSPGRMPKTEALPGSTGEKIGRDWLTVNENAAPLDVFPGLEIALSRERFATYLCACEGDRALALDAYALNADVSAALYRPIQNLEVALRNAFHARLSQKYGEWWFDELGVVTDIFQRQKLVDAKIEIVKEKKELAAGRIIASLSFGFWTSCLSARYEDTLWRRGGLSVAFMASGEKPKRRDINRALTQIRLLRNRIAHHEPILRLNLLRRRDEVLQVTRWVSPVMAQWSEQNCHFDDLFDSELVALFRRPRR